MTEKSSRWKRMNHWKWVYIPCRECTWNSIPVRSRRDMWVNLRMNAWEWIRKREKSDTLKTSFSDIFRADLKNPIPLWKQSLDSSWQTLRWCEKIQSPHRAENEIRHPYEDRQVRHTIDPRASKALKKITRGYRRKNHQGWKYSRGEIYCHFRWIIKTLFPHRGKVPKMCQSYKDSFEYRRFWECGTVSWQMGDWTDISFRETRVWSWKDWNTEYPQDWQSRIARTALSLSICLYS